MAIKQKLCIFVVIKIKERNNNMPEAIKNRTREEVIAAFRESLRKKREWEERTNEIIQRIRQERQQFSI